MASIRCATTQILMRNSKSRCSAIRRLASTATHMPSVVMQAHMHNTYAYRTPTTTAFWFQKGYVTNRCCSFPMPCQLDLWVQTSATYSHATPSLFGAAAELV